MLNLCDDHLHPVAHLHPVYPSNVDFSRLHFAIRNLRICINLKAHSTIDTHVARLSDQTCK
jgi:hypothetical protein